MIFSIKIKYFLSSAEGNSKNLGKMEGTWTNAKFVSPSLESLTAKFRLLFASSGNGRLLSTARGVNTGKIILLK